MASSRTPGRIVKAGSGIGEDTREVLTKDLGLSDDDVDQLVATQAVWCNASVSASLRTETSLAA